MTITDDAERAEFDALWPELCLQLIPGEFDLMDAHSEKIWRGVIEAAWQAGRAALRAEGVRRTCASMTDAEIGEFIDWFERGRAKSRTAPHWPRTASNSMAETLEILIEQQLTSGQRDAVTPSPKEEQDSSI